jgi:hypothetical protein
MVRQCCSFQCCSFQNADFIKPEFKKNKAIDPSATHCTNEFTQIRFTFSQRNGVIILASS